MAAYPVLRPFSEGWHKDTPLCSFCGERPVNDIFCGRCVVVETGYCSEACASAHATPGGGHAASCQDYGMRAAVDAAVNGKNGAAPFFAAGVDVMHMNDFRLCAHCMAPATGFCGGCGKETYCSNECLVLDAHMEGHACGSALFGDAVSETGNAFVKNEKARDATLENISTPQAFLRGMKRAIDLYHTEMALVVLDEIERDVSSTLDTGKELKPAPEIIRRVASSFRSGGRDSEAVAKAKRQGGQNARAAANVYIEKFVTSTQGMRQKSNIAQRLAPLVTIYQQVLAKAKNAWSFEPATLFSDPVQWISYMTVFVRFAYDAASVFNYGRQRGSYLEMPANMALGDALVRLLGKSVSANVVDPVIAANVRRVLGDDELDALRYLEEHIAKHTVHQVVVHFAGIYLSETLTHIIDSKKEGEDTIQALLVASTQSARTLLDSLVEGLDKARTLILEQSLGLSADTKLDKDDESKKNDPLDGEELATDLIAEIVISKIRAKKLSEPSSRRSSGDPVPAFVAEAIRDVAAILPMYVKHVGETVGSQYLEAIINMILEDGGDAIYQLISGGQNPDADADEDATETIIWSFVRLVIANSGPLIGKLQQLAADNMRQFVPDLVDKIFGTGSLKYPIMGPTETFKVAEWFGVNTAGDGSPGSVLVNYRQTMTRSATVGNIIFLEREPVDVKEWAKKKIENLEKLREAAKREQLTDDEKERLEAAIRRYMAQLNRGLNTMANGKGDAGGSGVMYLPQRPLVVQGAHPKANPDALGSSRSGLSRYRQLIIKIAKPRALLALSAEEHFLEDLKTAIEANMKKYEQRAKNEGHREHRELIEQASRQLQTLLRQIKKEHEDLFTEFDFLSETYNTVKMEDLYGYQMNVNLDSPPGEKDAFSTVRSKLAYLTKKMDLKAPYFSIQNVSVESPTAYCDFKNTGRLVTALMFTYAQSRAPGESIEGLVQIKKKAVARGISALSDSEREKYYMIEESDYLRQCLTTFIWIWLTKIFDKDNPSGTYHSDLHAGNLFFYNGLAYVDHPPRMPLGTENTLIDDNLYLTPIDYGKVGRLPSGVRARAPFLLMTILYLGNTIASGASRKDVREKAQYLADLLMSMTDIDSNSETGYQIYTRIENIVTDMVDRMRTSRSTGRDSDEFQTRIVLLLAEMDVYADELLRKDEPTNRDKQVVSNIRAIADLVRALIALVGMVSSAFKELFDAKSIDEAFSQVASVSAIPLKAVLTILLQAEAESRNIDLNDEEAQPNIRLWGGLIPAALAGGALVAYNKITLDNVWQVMFNLGKVTKFMTKVFNMMTIGVIFAGVAALSVLWFLGIPEKVKSFLSSRLPRIPVNEIQRLRARYKSDRAEDEDDSLGGVVARIVAELKRREEGDTGAAFMPGTDAKPGSAELAKQIEKLVKEILDEDQRPNAVEDASASSNSGNVRDNGKNQPGYDFGDLMLYKKKLRDRLTKVLTDHRNTWKFWQGIPKLSPVIAEVSIFLWQAGLTTSEDLRSLFTRESSPPDRRTLEDIWRWILFTIVESEDNLEDRVREEMAILKKEI